MKVALIGYSACRNLKLSICYDVNKYFLLCPIGSNQVKPDSLFSNKT